MLTSSELTKAVENSLFANTRVQVQPNSMSADLALSQIPSRGDRLTFCPSLTYKTKIYQALLFLAGHIYTIWWEIKCAGIWTDSRLRGDFGETALLSDSLLPNSKHKGTFQKAQTAGIKEMTLSVNRLIIHPAWPQPNSRLTRIHSET